MPASVSKSQQKRFWIKWYQSGAIAHPTFPTNSLTIEAIGKNFSGPAAGYSTLSLGNRVVNSGPGWSVSEPIYAVVVRTNDEKFRLKKILPKVPANAVPVDVFYKV